MTEIHFILGVNQIVLEKRPQEHAGFISPPIIPTALTAHADSWGEGGSQRRSLDFTMTSLLRKSVTA